MMRNGVRLGGVLVVTCLVAAADPPRHIAGWGHVLDPDGDCKVTAQEQKLSIAVPAKAHDLSVEVNIMNAPRVMSEVKGDFIVDVRILGEFRPAAPSTVNEHLPYTGSGLLVWQDEGNYLRLERAAIFRETEVVPYVNFELRKNGTIATSRGIDSPNQPIWLRIERRGGNVYAYCGPDRKQWQYVGSVEGELQGNVSLGVDAVSTSNAPFPAEIEGLEIFRKQAPQLPRP